jgi:hypothetical protein
MTLWLALLRSRQEFSALPLQRILWPYMVAEPTQEEAWLPNLHGTRAVNIEIVF